MILARGAGSAAEGESADQRERDPLRDCVGEFRLRAPVRASVGDGDRLGDGGPFVTFNCSNLVDSLAESQLFGHMRGALTDAREDSLVNFRSANGGTLFLDEIGELPLRVQPKLLPAVETQKIQPVGSSRSYEVDIRLVANPDLRAMEKAEQFRDDLYLNAPAIWFLPFWERYRANPPSSLISSRTTAAAYSTRT